MLNTSELLNEYIKLLREWNYNQTRFLYKKYYQLELLWNKINKKKKYI